MCMSLQTAPAARQTLQKVILDLFAQVQRLWDTLVALEKLHDVTERWLPASSEWKEAAAYMEVRDYQKALDKLEGLIVQHLFELTKMCLVGTGKCKIDQHISSSLMSSLGYKMQVHINKALKTWCKAIQAALKKYNTAAVTLSRPPLD